MVRHAVNIKHIKHQPNTRVYFKIGRNAKACGRVSNGGDRISSQVFCAVFTCGIVLPTYQQLFHLIWKYKEYFKTYVVFELCYYVLALYISFVMKVVSIWFGNHFKCLKIKLLLHFGRWNLKVWIHLYCLTKALKKLFHLSRKLINWYLLHDWSIFKHKI